MMLQLSNDKFINKIYFLYIVNMMKLIKNSINRYISNEENQKKELSKISKNINPIKKGFTRLF